MKKYYESNFLVMNVDKTAVVLYTQNQEIKKNTIMIDGMESNIKRKSRF